MRFGFLKSCSSKPAWTPSSRITNGFLRAFPMWPRWRPRRAVLARGKIRATPRAQFHRTAAALSATSPQVARDPGGARHIARFVRTPPPIARWCPPALRRAMQIPFLRACWRCRMMSHGPPHGTNCNAWPTNCLCVGNPAAPMRHGWNWALWCAPRARRVAQSARYVPFAARPANPIPPSIPGEKRK